MSLKDLVLQFTTGMLKNPIFLIFFILGIIYIVIELRKIISKIKRPR